MLLTGDGIARDPPRAIELLTLAAEAGDTQAAAALGAAHANGEGTPQSWPEGIKWTRKAAEAGDPAALTNIGIAYDLGIPGQPDPAEALVWYSKAASLGFNPAKVRLGGLYETGMGVGRGNPPVRQIRVIAAGNGFHDVRPSACRDSCSWRSWRPAGFSPRRFRPRFFRLATHSWRAPSLRPSD